MTLKRLCLCEAEQAGEMWADAPVCPECRVPPHPPRGPDWKPWAVIILSLAILTRIW